MSKKNGVKRTKHSQVEYATRVQVERAATIAVEREAAAKQAMKIACVALNDTEGLGYSRLCRFALHMQDIIAKLRDDPERTMYHIDNRLRKMGFIIDGVSIKPIVDQDGVCHKTSEFTPEELAEIEGGSLEKPLLP